MQALPAEKAFDEVFQIINEDTGEPIESPFAIVKREGNGVGLANHTVLITRDGRRLPIEDSGAPIRDPDGNMIGVIVVFTTPVSVVALNRSVRPCC